MTDFWTFRYIAPDSFLSLSGSAYPNNVRTVGSAAALGAGLAVTSSSLGDSKQSARTMKVSLKHRSLVTGHKSRFSEPAPAGALRTRHARPEFFSKNLNIA